MGWYINYYQKCSYITAQIVALYGHATNGHAHAAAAQQKYWAWWGDKWHASIKAISYYYSSHTRIELQDRSTPMQRQHSRNMRYGGVTNDRLRQKQLAAA